MAFCKNCGNRLNDGIKFCTVCGTAVDGQFHPPPQIQPPLPPQVQNNFPIKDEYQSFARALSTPPPLPQTFRTPPPAPPANIPPLESLHEDDDDDENDELQVPKYDGFLSKKNATWIIAGSVILCVSIAVIVFKNYGDKNNVSNSEITDARSNTQERVTINNDNNRTDTRSNTSAQETTRSSSPAVLKDDIIDLEMVFVQGGTFWMGCDEKYGDDCQEREKPQHRVTVSSFYIGKYEVTQKQWQKIMGTTIRQQRDKESKESSLRGEGDNYPMYYVSWNETQEFIRRLNATTGKQYRLPTEAEWEYAARGGLQSQGYKYSGSNNLSDVAWYNDNSGDSTHPVGTKQPNELGIYDMSGNVWEWCGDWFGNYSHSDLQDPNGSSSGSRRVDRGGSWHYGSEWCRVSARSNYGLNGRGYSLGFRLALRY